MDKEQIIEELKKLNLEELKDVVWMSGNSWRDNHISKYEMEELLNVDLEKEWKYRGTFKTDNVSVLVFPNDDRKTSSTPSNQIIQKYFVNNNVTKKDKIK